MVDALKRRKRRTDMSQKKYARLAPFYLCPLLLLLAGCSLFSGNSAPPKAGKAPANQQIYIQPIVGSADITTFDPALAYDQNSISAISMVFTGLVQEDHNFQIHGQLAQSWNESPDV